MLIKSYRLKFLPFIHEQPSWKDFLECLKKLEKPKQFEC